MRVLITGSSGQVGAALLPLFSARHEVAAPARQDFDLAQPQALTASLDRLAPELIVNPAAYTAVDRAEDERELADLVNAEAPGVIARWAAAHGVPLLHFSTDYVFDGGGDRPWTETDTCGPLGAYGRSKLAGEEAVRAAGGTHLIVRTAWVYASQGVNFMRTIIRLAREQLRIVGDQCGTPTSARSIAAAVDRIVSDRAPDLAAGFSRADGTLHLVNAGTTSWHGFASAIVSGLRARGCALKVGNVVPIATADYPTKAVRPANSRLDTSRLAAAYGITLPAWQDAFAVELDDFLAAESTGA